ncbi:MAG: hypothetical protein O7E57_09160 [Gammaproteobacteria bacterium]|nr:hypothetical protein [Gammaproteobacteria bacterium]
MALSASSQSEQPDWYVLWGDGDLTLRIRSGSCLGEDESGEISFRPSPQGCWIEFTIDNEDNLWVATAGNSYDIRDKTGERVNRIRLESGTQIELPNNLFHISTSMRKSASSGISVTLTPAEEPEVENIVDADYRQFPFFSGIQKTGETTGLSTELGPVQEAGFEQQDRIAPEDSSPTPFNHYRRMLLGLLPSGRVMLGVIFTATVAVILITIAT